MARIVWLKDEEERILLKELEAQDIRPEEATLLALGKGLYFIVGREAREALLDGLQSQAYEKLLKKIRSLDPKHRVEDRLEKNLSSEEGLLLKQLVRKGLVRKYKKAGYNKAVYVPKKAAEEKWRQTVDVSEVLGEVLGGNANNREKKGTGSKRMESKELDKKGFTVLKNENIAKEISSEREKDVKAGKLIGVRGFDKFFYIIDASLYKTLRPKALKALGQKEESLAVLSKKLNVEEDLARTVLEFLKEEGEVIEKKKSVFKAV